MQEWKKFRFQLARTPAEPHVQSAFFLLEGMIIGFVGAAIAAAALFQLYNAAQQKIYATLSFFPMLPSWPDMYYLCGGLIVVGTRIGACGSSIALRKFLDV